MFECVVCGTRTRERARLVGLGELIPICGERCLSLYLEFPLHYVPVPLEVGE